MFEAFSIYCDREEPVRIVHHCSLLLLAVTVACSSASTTPTPEVTEHGTYQVWYHGPEIEGELNYRWADGNLGDEWLVFRLSLAGTGGPSTLVERHAIRIRNPEGNTIALIDQNEFRKVYGSLRTAIDRAYGWGGPSTRFRRDRQLRDRWFFAPPFGGLAFDSLYASPVSVSSGPLIFRIAGGVQPGRWVLIIDLEESVARIPFVLGE